MQSGVGAGLFAARVNAIAWRVSFEPQPAITGTLPAATSTQISIARRCSAESSVEPSPVVPQGTRP